MRLIEETLIQADHELKTLISNHNELFIQVVKTLSQNKGSRWDDIVNKFEYQAIVLPALEKKIVSVSFAQVHKDHVL